MTIESWYQTVKKEIEENSNLKPDSISYSIGQETLRRTFWLKGKKLKQEYRSLDTATIFALTAYGNNEQFELRSEVHSNGQKATEGILFNDHYYGPWFVWYPNGQLNYRGLRYMDNDFGKWEYFFEDGRAKDVINNNRADLVDSILSRTDLTTSIKQN